MKTMRKLRVRCLVRQVMAAWGHKASAWAGQVDHMQHAV